MRSGEGFTMRNFIVCTIHLIQSGWAGHVVRMEEGRSALKILTGTPIGKGPLGRPRRRWEDNIRMDLEEVSMRVIGMIRLRIGIIGEPL